MSRPAAGTYALLADGVTVQIRPAEPDDLDAVRQMHEAMSAENSYLRFFSLSKVAAEREARRVCRPSAADHLALLAWLDGALVGVASCEPAGSPGTAEIAFAVADHVHGRGVAMLLLEHLVSAARGRGVRTFTAQTLAENAAMLRVFADTGLHPRRQLADGVTELIFDLPRGDADPGWDRYLDAVASRESHADVQSLRHLLAAESVVVVGASRRPGSVGQAILHSIVSGGYQGRLYAVNPHASQVDGISCLPSVAALPEPVDLAVVVVPAAGVMGVARECGRRGVKALVVITSALDSGTGAELLATCRRHGMRLVGPNCFGLAVPGLRLDATLAASHPAPGRAGLAVQSGGIGVALLEHLSRLGIGVSSFASLGDKYDVSGNDLLMWWEQDPGTELAVLYLESFGSPRKFARTARRAGASMPVLTVHAGRSAAGQRAATAHIATAPTAAVAATAVATSLVTREALFAQAGIIATRDIGELLESAALLASQPVPRGSRIAVVSNAGGAGVLAADACDDAGLQVAVLGARTRSELRRLLPAGAAVAGPVDTTATVTAGAFRQCLEQVAADEEVDVVLALTVPTALADLVPAACAAECGKPLVLTVLNQSEAVALLPRTPGGPPVVPAYAYPASAARALAHAARYGAWRARPPGHVPELRGLRPDDARTLIRAFLASFPDGGWLPRAEVVTLLGCYGVSLVPTRQAAGRGTEVIIGVAQEPVFGPLTVFGRGGEDSEVLGDHAARLTPLTDIDADELIRSVRAAPLLLGHHAAPAADLAALADLLLRISRLADDLPEVAELDLNPVIARPDGAFAVDAQVRVIPAAAADPFLRQLR